MIVKIMLIYVMDLNFFLKYCKFYYYVIYVFRYYYFLNCFLYIYSIYFMIDGKLIFFVSNCNISDEYIFIFGVICIYCCYNYFV